MNINGVGSSSCFYLYPSESSETLDITTPVDNSIEGSLLPPASHSRVNSTETIEAPPPYSGSGSTSDGCRQDTGLNQWPLTAAVPSSWSDFSSPALNFLGGAPGPSWSSLDLAGHSMRQYLPTSSSERKRPSSSGTREGKRSSRTMERDPKMSGLEFKKSGPKQQASCPHLKVRKERLGDRIAALQQLVAPYGKTDTASVLTDAIGYIKFLQDRVQVRTFLLQDQVQKSSLSRALLIARLCSQLKLNPNRRKMSQELTLPYIKLSRVGAEEKSRGVLRAESHGSNSKADQSQSLRRQGLCLIPSSCISHIDFGGCTGPLFNWSFPRLA
ncbi:hypothetical protein SAY87_004504 [Trapa incisa]|uniref:BHLH domain-containing protein n=1 Tax=Trapa incisa TaxID=236973 RepID=A0AAN7PKQ2_9MYRT|nr:hypothetical protein SAY87_004504 [Trapa incisa]